MIWILDRLLPTDTRGWLAAGVFWLMVYILSLVAFVKDLDKSQLFTALASGIVGSAFGAIMAYHFATTKTSQDKNDTLNKAINLAQTKEDKK